MARRRLEDFLQTALTGFEKGYGRDEAQSLERELLKGKIKSNLEQRQFKQNIELLKKRGFNVVPSGVDAKGNVKYKIEEPTKFKQPTKAKKLTTRKRLADTFLASKLSELKEQQSFLDIHSPLRSKFELIDAYIKNKSKFKFVNVFRKSGFTMDDVFKFGQENFPNEVFTAFPARRPLQKGLR